MLEDVLRNIVQVDFRDRVWKTASDLYGIERWFGFGAFERSARYCIEKLKEVGAENVELLDFPADGRASYWDKQLPMAWYPESGRLEVTSGGLENPVIADYERNPFGVAMWCAATPPGGVETEIVTENMMLAGHWVKGRIVLLEPSQRVTAEVFKAVCDRGGIGIVSERVNDPFITPDGVFWINSFCETPGWYPTHESRELLGFAVSPRVGAKLRQLLHRGKVKARAEVKAKTQPGKLYAATGVIEGASRPDEEIWLAAHLYEPLANDNCGGAAISMEVLRVLKDLIERGEMPRPERTIRAAMTLELYGFTALAKTLTERGKKLAASFTVDSVTIKQSWSRSPMRIRLSPTANPLFSDEVIKEAANLCLDTSSVVWKTLNGTNGENERVDYEFANGYFGNDAFLGDPMLGGPSFHFFAEPGPYWHNSDHTMDVLSPNLLAAQVAVHGALACYLGGLGPGDEAKLASQVELESRRYLLDAHKEFVSGGREDESFRKAMHLRMDMVRKRLENLRAWTGRDEEGAKALERLATYAEELLAEAGVDTAPPVPPPLGDLDKYERKAATAIFTRKVPTFPCNQVFVKDPDQRRYGIGGMSNILARMDGKKSLLQIIEEERCFDDSSVDVRRMLSNCVFLAEHGYLDVRYLEVVTKEQLVAGLRESGVGEGDLILAHISLSAFGHVGGGADTVIDALLESVGPKGTVLVPTFTHCMLYFDGYLPRQLQLEAFHPGLGHCWTGVVPSLFLRRPGIARSMHPSHSVAGIGPLAEKCTKEQRLDDPPTGTTSPFAKLAEFGGKLVYFGTTLAPSTFLHCLETKLNLWYLSGALCTVRDEHGDMAVVYNKQHLGGHRDFYRGDWQNTKIFRALDEAGLKIGHARVALGEIHTIDAREFEGKGLEAMRRDPMILLCDDPACLSCTQAKAVRPPGE